MMRQEHRFGKLGVRCALYGALYGCQRDDGSPDVSPPVCIEATNCPLEEHPTLSVRPEHKAIILDRLGTDPYDAFYDALVNQAAGSFTEMDPDEWDAGDIGDNASIAQANATLAWLHDDADAASVALEFFEDLPTNWETNTDWDINIRMSNVLLPAVDAWDLLAATDFMSVAQSQQIQQKLTTINGAFYAAYVEEDAMRQASIGVSQNNHSIRTASAIGYVALAFPDDPDAPVWRNWAISEMDYLLGPNGQYIQPDGGVSEGPFYFAFGMSAGIPFLIAVDNATDANQCYQADCINRQDVEPWRDHGCVDGTEFAFENPLLGDVLPAAIDWHIHLRLPSGDRAPLADSNLRELTGGALIGAYTGDGWTRWDWENHAVVDEKASSLPLHHLAYLDESLESEEPPWTTDFLLEVGHAVFRSSWDEDAIWGMLVAEAGAARMTLHDHVDGTSFSVAGYGDYLLIDTGYYKIDEWALPETADADAHNVILIDGQGAPDKGPLHDFGDADASLENTFDGQTFDYAEAWQTYEQTEIQRSMVFVRERYFVIADRLETTLTESRSHAWRVHAFAGYGAGGTFTVEQDGLTVEQDNGSAQVYLTSTGGAPTMTEPEYNELVAPHVHKFERSVGVNHHGVVDGIVEETAPDFLAVIAPFRTGTETGDSDGPLVVTAVENDGAGAAWLVESEHGVDLVWLRETDHESQLVVSDLGTFETDAALVIYGVNDGATLLVRGSSLSVDEQTVATADATDGAIEVSQ